MTAREASDAAERIGRWKAGGGEPVFLYRRGAGGEWRPYQAIDYGTVRGRHVFGLRGAGLVAYAELETRKPVDSAAGER